MVEGEEALRREKDEELRYAVEVKDRNKGLDRQERLSMLKKRRLMLHSAQALKKQQNQRESAFLKQRTDELSLERAILRDTFN